ncbi:NAD(+) diphosphatase [Ferribacterium limneticum]|uniref:NAD(+) diphosphatase n=1 Tax=Ferribacterium limneticum TaxID=76259 RepID=UPI001CFA7B55|nr:NAD(+) diphosphatase [Ferribacterium limneticum]UCV20017.1 NAD(+) diphosphatase [Ferribacterium limneticum]
MNQAAYWILRCEHRLLTIGGAESVFPAGLAADFGHPVNVLHVGNLNGLPCHAADVAHFPEIPGSEATPLRAIFSISGAETFALAGRATQLLDWQANHRFCGKCGTPTVMKEGELAMQCPVCSLLAYPRISPAVMVLVRDGERLLLARSPHFKPGVFSALAGFVEPGETLEECAAREVREEVGIEIANLRYFHSQPWPFPNSLMVAFFADYAGGTLRPDPNEIEEAGWFSPDALPILPEPISISRRLIEAELHER